MPRLDTNRAAEMEVFVRVVDLGGFTAAAHEFRLSASGVSKLISRLEGRLGTRLLNRSTRRLTLTPEGEAFHARAVPLLAELDAAESEAASGSVPHGHLRINSSIPFGMRYALPLVPAFLARYPRVTLDLVLSDTVVDLMQDRTDIAIRMGALRDSGLTVRKLATSRMVVVGAPDYLARYGTPEVPRDLARHRSIGWTFPRTIGPWPFRASDPTQADITQADPTQAGFALTPPVIARASDGEAVRVLALGGVGLARLARFHVGPDLAEGRLVPVLEPHNPGDCEDIHAVYLGRGGPLPARVRAFVDFLAEAIRADPALP